MDNNKPLAFFTAIQNNVEHLQRIMSLQPLMEKLHEHHVAKLKKAWAEQDIRFHSDVVEAVEQFLPHLKERKY